MRSSPAQPTRARLGVAEVVRLAQKQAGRGCRGELESKLRGVHRLVLLMRHPRRVNEIAPTVLVLKRGEEQREKARAACENNFRQVSGSFSSCRSPQTALKCSYRSDRVTRDRPVALRVRAAKTETRKGLDGPACSTSARGVRTER